MPLSPLFARYQHVVLDLDGVVWVGEQCTREAPQAIAELRAGGKTIAFVTNDARRSPEEYVRKLWSLGVQASLEEIVTVGASIQHMLAEREPRTGAYVIGAPALFRHINESGHRVLNGTPNANKADVVVLAAHDELRFGDLGPAIEAVLGGAEIIAAGRDPTYPTQDGPSPGTGALVAALEYATGRTARIIGKPDPQIFRTALDRLGEGRTLVIGDRLDSDLAGAVAAGLDAAIVLSGATTRPEAQAASDPAPVAIADDLHSLVVAG